MVYFWCNRQTLTNFNIEELNKYWEAFASVKFDLFEKVDNERCADEFVNHYEYSYGKLDDLFEEAIAKATDNFTSEFKGRGKEIFRKAYPDKDFEHGIYKMFGTWMRSNITAIMKKYNIFICTRPAGNAGKIYWIIPNE